jgi:hypothetical protein
MPSTVIANCSSMMVPPTIAHSKNTSFITPPPGDVKTRLGCQPCF